MNGRDQALTVVDRLLSVPPSRLDRQLAAVVFGVVFLAAGALIGIGRVLWPSRDAVPRSRVSTG